MAASLQNWITSYPKIPEAEAIQRIFIDAAGEKRFVALANGEFKEHDKLSLGLTTGKVFCLGNPQASFVTICEGVADCLALASRLEGLHICTLGTSGMKTETFTPLERIPDRKVSICCDNDSAGKEQAEKLRTGLIEKGIPALIEIPPPPNKDFAALAETEPWPELSFDVFKERALSLEKDGKTKQEAERLALIHSIDRKDTMNSFKEIQQNAENMPEETINEAKQNQEQEVARNDKARAVIKALKEKFIKGNLSREEKVTFLESMHVLAPEKKEGSTDRLGNVSGYYGKPGQAETSKAAIRRACGNQHIPFPCKRLVACHAESSLVITWMDRTRTHRHACRRRRAGQELVTASIGLWDRIWKPDLDRQSLYALWREHRKRIEQKAFVEHREKCPRHDRFRFLGR